MAILKKIIRFLGYYLKGIFIRFHEDDLLFMASGLSFDGILCTIPLLLLLTSILGIFLSSSYLAFQQLDELLKAAFPTDPYNQTINATIRHVLSDIMEYKTSFGIIGMAVLAWTATFLFSGARSILNKIYRFKSTKHVLLTILEDFLWVTLVGVLFIITSIFPWLMSIARALLAEAPALGKIQFGQVLEFLPAIVTSILTFIMFFILYLFIPDGKIDTRTAVVSALTTTILWVGAGRVFSWYLATFHSFTKLYGTYAFLLVFIVWIYYSSVVFITGAVIGQLYREQYKDHHHAGRTAENGKRKDSRARKNISQ